MKRTGFARKLPPRPAREDRPRPPMARLERMPNYAPANDRVFAIPKEDAIQQEGYMRLVRQLPCAMCGVIGFSQFCHSDEGKGLGIKSDCRTGWPGCGPRPGIPGCHYLVGTAGTYTRDERRALEARMAAETRAKILALGQWPKTLPPWDD